MFLFKNNFEGMLSRHPLLRPCCVGYYTHQFYNINLKFLFKSMTGLGKSKTAVGF